MPPSRASSSTRDDLIADDDGLFLLLDAFLGEVTIHSVETPRARKHSYLIQRSSSRSSIPKQ
jgi:hypothetical protein